MGKLVEIKTRPTDLSVAGFIDSVPNEQKRKDSYVILALMEKATKEKPKIWGSSIIGFGDVRYKSPSSGREVDWFKIGFSPRKTNLTIYMGCDVKKHGVSMKQLGKHKTGMGCLYINKLADVDVKVLEKMINEEAK